MALYEVTLRGDNFLMNFTGEPELVGFRVTHYVKADDPDAAQRIAAIHVRKDRRINDSLLNTRDNPRSSAARRSARSGGAGGGATGGMRSGVCKPSLPFQRRRVG